MSFVDSTIPVDLLRGYPPALQWFSHQSNLAITPIVWMEVILGTQNQNAQRQALQLLSSFQLQYLTQADMDWTMKTLENQHLRYGVQITDCLIASIRARLQVPLYTHNRKHIEPILGKTLTVTPY